MLTIRARYNTFKIFHPKLLQFIWNRRQYPPGAHREISIVRFVADLINHVGPKVFYVTHSKLIIKTLIYYILHISGANHNLPHVKAMKTASWYNTFRDGIRKFIYFSKEDHGNAFLIQAEKR